MLFNSYVYVLLFLPATVFVYFILNKRHFTLASKAWLVLSSLFFYGWWNIKYVPLIAGSILFNYAIGAYLGRIDGKKKKVVLIFGIVLNVLLLGYFKYTNFIIENIGGLTDTHPGVFQIVLPLGISFFTFTQIAYLVDTYKREAREYHFLSYALFVTFFPHLLAGPIIHHKEMMPQFDRLKGKVINFRNISTGLYLFFIGLFKKVIIADAFAASANMGFDTAQYLTMPEAWITSLSYTLQIYFDFSGYTDMALGSALMFNIKLPVNFNSPYKAGNVREFWQRWHITLSRFLRDYIYIPCGGNRNGEFNTCRNLMLTFLIGGLWHGAGWTFIFWGFLHGMAIVVHRMWGKTPLKMNALLAWFLTFNFVNITWIFFRARSWADAVKVLKGMAGLNGVMLPSFVENYLTFLKSLGVGFDGALFGNTQPGTLPAVIILAGLVVALSSRNSDQMALNFRPTWKTALVTGVIGVVSVLHLNRVSEFLYFQF